MQLSEEAQLLTDNNDALVALVSGRHRDVGWDAGSMIDESLPEDEI